MKKCYQPATIPACIVCACMIAWLCVGLFLLIFVPEQESAIFYSLAGGGIGTVFGLACCIPLLTTYLTIDHEKVVFPLTRVPHIRFRRNVVYFDQIKYIKATFRPGDGIVTANDTVYTFYLTNGVEFTENLHSYFGKRNADIIVAHLQQHGITVQKGHYTGESL